MSTTKTLEDVLAHYGILGMRWGVRRSERQLARARGDRLEKGKPVTPTKTGNVITRSAKAQADFYKRSGDKPSEKPSEKSSKVSEDAQKAKESLKKAKKGGAKTLTNQELKELNERLNLEQNYNRLTSKKGQGKIKKGKKFIDDAVDMGKTVNEVYKLANSPMVKEVSKGFKEKDKKK